MHDRVTHQTVRFMENFSLMSQPGTFPPGEYEIEITEEQLPGLSFTAYRRVSSTIRLPGSLSAHASWQLVAIEEHELAAALKLSAVGQGPGTTPLSSEANAACTKS
jgi:hypothetical protein